MTTSTLYVGRGPPGEGNSCLSGPRGSVLWRGAPGRRSGGGGGLARTQTVMGVGWRSSTRGEGCIAGAGGSTDRSEGISEMCADGLRLCARLGTSVATEEGGREAREGVSRRDLSFSSRMRKKSSPVVRCSA